MIQIPFSMAVGLYAGFSLLGIFMVWLFFEGYYPFKNFSFTQRHFWRCTICITPYVDSLSDEFSRCPHCHHLNQREKQDDH